MVHGSPNGNHEDTMTPTPTPPPSQGFPNAMNVAKMVIGGLTSLGCLALVAFNTKLGIGLSPDIQLVLLGVAVGGGVLGSHGALKTPTDG